VTVLDSLRAATSLTQLASVLGYPASTLAYILYKGPTGGRYSKFGIPKRSGGTRDIHAPDDQLKALQKAMVVLLDACNAEITNSRGFPDGFSHGFEHGRSIITNAWAHKNRRFVLNLDLENFFPTINFGRVRGFFLKNRNFALQPTVATILAQIACFDNSLPQGAPSSPVISNMIAHIMDVRLGKLAAATKCTYTRYADDLTFSTNQKDFPAALACELLSIAGRWELSDLLVNEIRRSGFVINPAKTRMQRRPSQQIVTGLTVNEKVNIRATYYRAARVMCDSLFKYGSYFRGAVSSKNLPPETPPKRESGIAYLEGVMAHIYHVKHTSDLRSGRLDPKKEAEDAKKTKYAGYRQLYKKLLYYKHFVALEQPLIVCEGKTDNIYLRSALKALDPKYPQLAIVDNGKLVTAVTFLRHSRVEHDILELSGGSGNIGNLVGRYEKAVSRYAHRPLKHPVIVLVDNDSGSDPVFGAMKQHNVTVSQTTTLAFYHVCFNLYVVKTPEFGTKGTSCIEDLFDTAILAETLDGKTLSRVDKFDPSQQYGKFDFADKIIRPRFATINFSRFGPLLDRMVAVLNDYQLKK
jgi:RNA-directed DNA polymerase